MKQEQSHVDKREVLDKLTALAERDLHPVVQQRANEFLGLLPQAVAADYRDLALARAVPMNMYQVPAIFAEIEAQGRVILAELDRLTVVIRTRLETLAKSAEVPRRMVGIGTAWRKQAARLTEMIATAERLSDQPDWKGRASEAHLSVLPRQITAMQDLRALAETASESVLLVGAIQNNIFDACALVFSEAMESLRGQTSSAPIAYFGHAAACVALLNNVDLLLNQWISGEGTWQPSASQVAEGLTKTSGAGFVWPKAVSGTSGKGSADKDKKDQAKKDEQKSQDKQQGTDKGSDKSAGQSPDKGGQGASNKPGQGTGDAWNQGTDEGQGSPEPGNQGGASAGNGQSDPVTPPPDATAVDDKADTGSTDEGGEATPVDPAADATQGDAPADPRPAVEPTEPAPEQAGGPSTEGAGEPADPDYAKGGAPVTEPAPSGPVPNEPAPLDPVPTDPVPADPAPTDPVPNDTAPSDTAPTEPMPTDPVPTEPVPTDPVPTEPIPTDPAPGEPAQTDPAPNDKAPGEPSVADPGADTSTGGPSEAGAQPGDAVVDPDEQAKAGSADAVEVPQPGDAAAAAAGAETEAALTEEREPDQNPFGAVKLDDVMRDLGLPTGENPQDPGAPAVEATHGPEQAARPEGPSDVPGQEPAAHGPNGGPPHVPVDQGSHGAPGEDSRPVAAAQAPVAQTPVTQPAPAPAQPGAQAPAPAPAQPAPTPAPVAPPSQPGVQVGHNIGGQPVAVPVDAQPIESEHAVQRPEAPVDGELPGDPGPARGDEPLPETVPLQDNYPQEPAQEQGLSEDGSPVEGVSPIDQTAPPTPPAHQQVPVQPAPEPPVVDEPVEPVRDIDRGANAWDRLATREVLR